MAISWHSARRFRAGAEKMTYGSRAIDNIEPEEQVSAMPVVCSRCSNHFEPGRPCPRCGAPSPVVVAETASPFGHGPRWQQTVFGRLLIGLVLAQGLFYASRHLLTGVLLAFHEGEGDLWADSRNVFLLFSVQLFAVFVGGIFSGSGQRYGFFVGLMVGVWNGVASALLKQNPAANIVPLGFFTQPVFQSCAALLGGVIGSVIWKPIIDAPAKSLAPTKKAAKRSTPTFTGPIAWGRVAFGCVAVVCASLYTTKLLNKLIDLSGNKIGTGDDFQDLLITWEIKAFLVLLGAFFAGVATKNGLKQGLVVGLLASSILIGIQAPASQNLLRMVGSTIAGTVGLCLAGGWFGGQLFPPLMSRHRPTSGTGSW